MLILIKFRDSNVKKFEEGNLTPAETVIVGDVDDHKALLFCYLHAALDHALETPRPPSPQPRDGASKDTDKPSRSQETEIEPELLQRVIDERHEGGDRSSKTRLRGSVKLI